jgi:hypothetical protein
MAVDQEQRGREGTRRTGGDDRCKTTDLALWLECHPTQPKGIRGFRSTTPSVLQKKIGLHARRYLPVEVLETAARLVEERMTQVILQPAGKHYDDTIKPPVPMERLARFLDAADLTRLHHIYSSRPVPTWGVTPGARGANRRKWQRITPGAVVLMARAGHLIASATVTHTTHNRALATELWGTDQDGETWEYLYFLDDVRDQAIPYAELNRAAGYAPGQRRPRLQRPARGPERGNPRRAPARGGNVPRSGGL